MESKPNIISEASECTVNKFIRCAFQDKFRVLLIEGEATDEELKSAFENIEAQYVDISGLFQTREFEMSGYIDFLGKRVSTVQRFIELQFRFIDEFQVPFIPAFGLVKRYGHTLYWNPAYPDLELFKKKLTTIELKEKKYHSILNTKIKELIDFRKKIVKKDYTKLETRQQFITTLNRLQQARFAIDRDKTTMEEIGLMIKDHKDQVETEKAQANAKKR